MAIGWSGSAGGIGEVYRTFVKADIEAGILKYGGLIEKIPKGMPEIKEYYKEIVQNLETLKDKIPSTQNLASKI